MICPNCKTSLPADASFCPNCGARPPAHSPETHSAAAPERMGARTFSGPQTITPMRKSETAMLEPGSLFAERYEVASRIGAGGMGVVYLARDSHTGEELVLKLIHPDLVGGEDAVKRLMAEGMTARHIRHPKIVAVYDVAQYGDQAYFTMEYVRGGTLRSWMNKHMAIGQDVSLATAAGVIKSMLGGITEAHRMGIVHRDLKPENVLLVGNPDEDDFDLKILDFGIAKAVNTPRSASGGGPMGTPLYMAPEQMTAAETVGPAADIYSLSVILYELLMEASPQARWEPVSKSRPDVPKTIDDLIEKGLSVRPRSRHATAAEFEKALDAAMSGIRPGPPPPPPSDDRFKRPFVPDPLPPPPTPPPPPPVHGGMWANLSPKARMWIYGIAAIITLASVYNSVKPPPAPPPPVDSDGDGVVDAVDGCPVVPGPATNGGCPVTGPNGPGGGGGQGGGGQGGGGQGGGTTRRTVVTERWRDEAGNVFTVERNGPSFEGDADNVRSNGVFYGHVDIEGVVAPNGGNILMTNDKGLVYQSPIGAAVPGTAPGTTDALFGTLRFHINH